MTGATQVGGAQGWHWAPSAGGERRPASEYHLKIEPARFMNRSAVRCKKEKGQE